MAPSTAALQQRQRAGWLPGEAAEPKMPIDAATKMASSILLTKQN